MSREEKLELFENTFNAQSAGCVRTCNCGKTYFHDSATIDYDWEEGELEKLRADGAIALDYSCRDIIFYGKEFVDACPCWQEDALKIMDFLDSHGSLISRYFKERKRLAILAAAATPDIDDT